MAVSQISMSDNDITGHQAPIKEPEKKEEVNKKFDPKQSDGMDDLMSNLTSANKPAGIYKKK